jgi:small subunit ribosomal protein S1
MNDDDMGRAASHRGEDVAAAQSAELPSDNGMEALLRDNEYAFRSLRRGETVEGTIVRIDQDEVLVDVGMKSEGVIPARELYTDGEDAEPLNVGDHALVYVMQPEGSEGHAILSLRRARMERSWRDIEEVYHRGAIIDAPVVDYNKGGLIVDVKGVRGFVPVSQVLDLRNVTRQEGESEEVSQTLAGMDGRRLPLKIIEINRSRNRLILSERAAVQEQRTQRKDELLGQLQPGQIRRGVVSNLTSFGAFVDLGGADGLVHVSELSYNRVNHPSEILHVGQEVDIMVLSIDRDTKKIALSLKRALPDPWTTVEDRYRVGEVVPATITKLAKFGAFAKVEEGLDGLIHLTELTDLPVQEAFQVVQENQRVNVKIIHINSQKRRLGLSIRQAGDPQLTIQSFGTLDTVPDINLTGELTAEQEVEFPEPATDVTSQHQVVESPETQKQDPELYDQAPTPGQAEAIQTESFLPPGAEGSVPEPAALEPSEAGHLEPEPEAPEHLEAEQTGPEPEALAPSVAELSETEPVALAPSVAEPGETEPETLAPSVVELGKTEPEALAPSVAEQPEPAPQALEPSVAQHHEPEPEALEPSVAEHHESEPEAPEHSGIVEETVSLSPESQPTAGEQVPPATESEPQNPGSTVESAEAAATLSAPSGPPEAVLSSDEEEQPRMAEAGHQGKG